MGRLGLALRSKVDVASRLLIVHGVYVLKMAQLLAKREVKVAPIADLQVTRHSISSLVVCHLGAKHTSGEVA
jgi:hypothetical protein